MKLLLDTHTFLWWITDDARLSAHARELMSQADNELFLSAASAWEMAIKARLGRLEVSGDLSEIIPQQLARNAISSLPVLMSHALGVYTLPDHHRDPFDRLLISQAQIENIPILTADAAIGRYPVEVIW